MECHTVSQAEKKLVIWQQTGNKQDIRLNSIDLRTQHSIVVKDLLSAAWKNSSRPKIGQFGYLTND